MSFSQFIKPYPDGYEDFEVGGTPVTAEILNTNYDGFLLALNSWASDVENDIGDAKNDITGLQGSISNIQSALSNKVDTSTFNQLGDAVRNIGIAVNGKSTVSISDLLQSGTKVATLTIDGTQYDLYAPSGGGGGSSVTWNQIVSTGTKIAEIEIDGVSTDIYAPSGSGTGGHTIIDENGNSMTARAGLQFVGANVSDDSTNNKTIVDLASAGGIDGVFIDIGNVIQTSTQFNNPLSYTAVEDCIISFIVTSRNGDVSVKIDNNMIAYYSGNTVFGYSALLKKGQTLFGDSGQNYSGTYQVFGIQTGTTHSKFQPVIYSTEEREIGVWTDGKPLYEKTWDFGADASIPANSWTDTPITKGDIEKIVDIKAVNDAGTIWDMLGANTDQTYIQVYHSRGNNAAISIRYVTLQYTKTTDVAGSGSWTPQGVPTHHYSTDEHIVGTWIDGSTIYEKTIYAPTGTFITVSDWTQISGFSNIGKMIDTKINVVKGTESRSVYQRSDNVDTLPRFEAYNGGIYYFTDTNTFAFYNWDWYITFQYTKTS